MGLWKPEVSQVDVCMVLWVAKYLSTRDLKVPLRSCWEDECEEFTQLVMSQNTADATTVQRKQGINEAGRGIPCGRLTAVFSAFGLSHMLGHQAGR